MSLKVTVLFGLYEATSILPEQTFSILMLQSGESTVFLYSDSLKDDIAKSSLIAAYELFCRRLKPVSVIASSKCKECHRIITKFIFQCMIFVTIQRSICKE